MMLVLSSFVFSAGSEISMDFVVDAHKQEVSNYVSNRSFLENNLWCVFVFFAVLVFAYFILSNKKSLKKKLPRKKISKKKRVSKKAGRV